MDLRRPAVARYLALGEPRPTLADALGTPGLVLKDAVVQLPRFNLSVLRAPALAAAPYEQNVRIGSLTMRANCRCIEEEIPHIASLMCPSAEALLAHAEVIVIGNACEDATEMLAAARPEHLTVDLTRGQAERSSSRSTAGI